MKTATMKKPSIHSIPLIILTMLFLYSTSSFANSTLPHSKSYQKSPNYTILAKGQAYVPPQKHCDCALIQI